MKMRPRSSDHAMRWRSNCDTVQVSVLSQRQGPMIMNGICSRLPCGGNHDRNGSKESKHGLHTMILIGSGVAIGNNRDTVVPPSEYNSSAGSIPRLSWLGLPSGNLAPSRWPCWVRALLIHYGPMPWHKRL